jgi:TonB family protein
MIPETADSMTADSLNAGALRTETIQSDARDCRTRTRRAMGTSTVVHTLLISWLVLLPEVGRQPEITEITLLDPAVLTSGLEGIGGPSLSAPAAPARRGAATIGPESPGFTVAHSSDISFRRARARGQVSPAQQSDPAFADRLEARLSALQADAASPTKGVAAASLTTPAPLWGSALVPTSGTGAGSGGKAPIELKRGGSGLRGTGQGRSGVGTGSGRTPGLAQGGGSVAPGVQGLAMPKMAAATVEAAKPPSETKATARRDLAGMKLMGPIADRSILHYTVPQYPEWAKREGVEGSVSLYFVVLADGRLKESIVVQKTAGFEDFDENAIAALRTWKFEPLRRGQTGEQWGTITIHYRLAGA